MDELQGIIEIMLPGIKEKLDISSATFNLWFGDFKLISLDDRVAVFQTKTEMRRRILLTKYINYIKEELFSAIGFEVQVVIESEESKSSFSENEPSDLSTTAEAAEENRKREQKIKELIEREDGEEGGSVMESYTFDNFIEGASNKFAKAVCLAVADTLSPDYNPLFIYGNSGLGKTHLLCAIINRLKKKYPKIKIVYKKCEDFLNELILAISTFSTNSFKEKYRSADVLLIDDIQFIAGKKETQEEFFHTFSYLYESNKHIILTSDRPPHEIRPLSDRLRTRFEGSLLADIQPPSPELRAAIIRKKSQDLDIVVPPELVDYMTERLHENIRQIEGVIKKIAFLNKFNSSPITKELIDSVISVIDPDNIPIDILINRIIARVADKYSVTVDDIKSKKKTNDIANARHIAAYIIRKLTSKSYQDIGDIFHRDRTSIMYSCEKIEMDVKTVKGLDGEIKKIIREIKDV